VKHGLGPVFLALVVCTGIGAGAKQVNPVWMPVTSDSPDLPQLVRDHPDSASARLRWLNTRIGSQDREGALQALAWLRQHGHVFSSGAQARLKTLLAEWGKSSDGLILSAASPREASAELARVPAEAQLVESVVRDAKTGRLFASTVVSRQLWVREPDGRWHALALEGIDSLSGMAIDPRQRLLWVASSGLGMGQSAPDVFHGLIAVDPDSLAVRRRIAAPPEVNPSDIAGGRGGTFYASDPLKGGVYRAGPDASSLTELVPPGTFRSPQGLAESADSELLYVSDYRYGLAAVSLRSGAIVRVGAPASLAVPLDGIDGLWRVGNSLVGVQNGTSPMRIVRFELGRGRTSVIRAEVLEQAHPAWTEPTSGAIEGNSLIYVATGQWDRFQDGAPVAGKPPIPTQLRILSLRTTKH
jgi:hypothetical protein